jgi:hypothetical protein
VPLSSLGGTRIFSYMKNAKTYFIQANDGRIKIGVSTKPENRLKQLQTAHSEPLVILLVVQGDIERKLHSQFAELRLSGEWFKPESSLLTWIAEQKTIHPKITRLGPYVISTYCDTNHCLVRQSTIHIKIQLDEDLESFNSNTKWICMFCKSGVSISIKTLQEWEDESLPNAISTVNHALFKRDYPEEFIMWGPSYLWDKLPDGWKTQGL